MAINEFAPAKINLALHVTGQRDDRYHLIDSLVAFAGVGDVVAVDMNAPPGLEISGPFASHLSNAPNLVQTALELVHPGQPAGVHLQKNLPVASGIGGGSSDAAATIRAVQRLTNCPPPTAQSILALGADVPVCLVGETARVGGVGDKIDPVRMPQFPAVLVNPGQGLKTSEVFDALIEMNNTGMASPPQAQGASVWIDWIISQRNDLQPPAIDLVPAISTVLKSLHQQPGQRIARMSGSGATCFALFDTQEHADSAACAIAENHPHWWVVATTIGGDQLTRSTT